MMYELQTNLTITKENRSRSRRLCLKLGFMLMTVFIALGMVNTTASAAGGLKIYNYSTKKETTYKDKQIKVTLNGEAIGKKQIPGVLVNGSALVPYDEIFKKSEIAAECVYDKDQGTVSISKYGKTILMTIGSTKAKVNGKAVTLPVAPVKVKYVDINLVKVLVPSRFVSETLGLGYTWNSSTSTVAIVKTSLLLSYDSGDRFEYTGTLGKVTVNGKNINLGNMPSIITNNTAMLRAKSVFTNAAIGASYSYSSADKKITLTKGDTVLVMTVGSKTAYLNGVAAKLETAPMIVKNHNINTSYVMVPGSFTAASLGYNYIWDNTTRTSIITTKKDDGSNSPELGDESVIIEPGTILNQWSGNDTLYGNSSNVHELNPETSATTSGTIYSVARDYSNSKLNAETFQVIAAGSFGRVTSSSSDKRLVIQASNMTCTDMTYSMLGTSSNYVNTIGTYANSTEQTTSIELEMLSSDYSYELSLSEDKQILYVTVYYNAITSAVLGTNNAGDYLTLTGLKPLKVTMNKTEGLVYVDLPYTASGLGEINTSVAGSKYINLIYTISSGDKTQLILGVKEGYELYISEKENKFSLLLQIPGAVQQPDPNPGAPAVTDPSQYNIIIPKPAGLTGSMITDEDDYYNNRFVIRLAGDYTSGISSSNISNGAATVKNITVSQNSRNETEIVFNTTKLQGYKYAVDDNNIYVKVGNPKDIYPNIVILDAGHGGGANGAQYFGTKEKDLNYKILYTLGKKYFNQDTSKLKVYYTRSTDVDMTLSNRAAFAGKYGADLFVSLHMNASLNKSAYGTEVYYSSNNNSPNSAGLTSKLMADLFCDRITGNMGTKNRGSRAERYTVVHKNTVPAVLIELGFLSNESDFLKLSDSTFQENAAKTIYETLLEVFRNYPTGR
jgi:N-acetylmuramoyl-L-alanine amidase